MTRGRRFELNAQHLIAPNGAALALTPIERRIVALLLQRRSCFMPATTIVSAVWEVEPDEGLVEALRAHVSNIRKKLRQAAIIGALRSRPGVGYGLFE